VNPKETINNCSSYLILKSSKLMTDGGAEGRGNNGGEWVVVKSSQMSRSCLCWLYDFAGTTRLRKRLLQAVASAIFSSSASGNDVGRSLRGAVCAGDWRHCSGPRHHDFRAAETSGVAEQANNSIFAQVSRGHSAFDRCRCCGWQRRDRDRHS